MTPSSFDAGDGAAAAHVPIPSPDGTIYEAAPLYTATPGDWAGAPPIVKHWAWPLTILAIMGSLLITGSMAFVVMAGPSASAGAAPQGMSKILLVVYFALLTVSVWLCINLRKGNGAAWTVQKVLSIIGLLGIPLGTLIHGYILSQWSKPEVKAWFGK